MIFNDVVSVRWIRNGAQLTGKLSWLALFGLLRKETLSISLISPPCLSSFDRKYAILIAEFGHFMKISDNLVANNDLRVGFNVRLITNSNEFHTFSQGMYHFQFNTSKNELIGIFVTWLCCVVCV